MTIVVKIGGGTGVATTNIAREIAQCVAGGQRIVVLHGASDLTNVLSQRLGHPVRMITSPGGMVSRYTDSETLHIYAMAVAGHINTELVACLQQLGVNALGLAGVDGRLLLAKRKSAIRSVTPEGRVQIVRDDYTGQIEQVNGALLRQLLDTGYTPVAAALHADALVIMTNVPGLLANADDYTTLIRTIPADQLADYMGCAQGRMRKKLLGAQEALQGGVSKVCIGSASLLDVLNGAGTTIAREHEQAMPTLVHDIPGERNHR